MASALRLLCQWWFDAGGTRVHWRASGQLRVVAGRVVLRVPDARDHPEPLPSVAQERSVDAWVASLGADDVMEAGTPWEDPPELTSRRRRHPAAGVARRGRRGGRGARPRPAAAPDAGARVLDAATFPEWLLARRERMAAGTMMVRVADAATDRCLGEVLVFVHEGTLADDTAELGYQVLPRGARARGGDRRGAAARGARAGAPPAGRDGPAPPRGEDRRGQRRQQPGARQRRLHPLGHQTAADALPDGRTVDALHWELLAEA